MIRRAQKQIVESLSLKKGHSVALWFLSKSKNDGHHYKVGRKKSGKDFGR